MDRIRYPSSVTNEEMEISLATAALDQLLDAYDSLLERSVFPVKTAKRYADALQALIAARPDLLEHRKSSAAARTARLGCTCPPKSR